MRTLTRSGSAGAPAQSASTCSATTSARSWLVSMEERLFGGMPYRSGSKSIRGRNAPRRPYVLSTARGSGS
jgi:hypothetical protein